MLGVLGTGAATLGLQDSSRADGRGGLHALSAYLGIDQTQAAREPSPHALELRPPDGAALRVDIARYRAPLIADGQLRAAAYEFDSHVYARPAKRPIAIGLVRRGTVLRVRERVRGPACRGGWYPLPTRGFVCSGGGFAVSRHAWHPSVRQPRPDVRRALPFRYGRVNSRSALRFFRIPRQSEEAALLAHADGEPWPEVVSKQLDGDYFVAIDRIENAGERSFYRTISGRYVRTERVDLKSEPKLHGQLLGPDMQLPLAFVYGDEQRVPLLRKLHGKPRVIGSAHKYARFQVAGVEHWGDTEVVVGRGRKMAVEHRYVRIARKRPRPDGIPRGAKWIHVDLGRQVLVAYRGDRPVFATLVSSGREDGHATPTGLFHVREKHITVTMRGADPVQGPYEVAEVPWTMYYWNSYALHGAYWHDSFGNTRSHGCTNLAPLDARWLFHFTDDALPAGWHARRQLKGTFVYFTRDQSAES